MSKAAHFTYDKTIKVGDIVTAYQKGYWRVLDIEPRNNITVGSKTIRPNPLVTLELVLDSNGKHAKRKESKCDIWYCKKIDLNEVNKIITYDLEFFETKKQNLLELVTKEAK